MSRLTPIDPARAEARRKKLLADVQATFGATPNLFRTAANSETALEAMLEMFKTIGAGTLGAPLIEKIAVAVSEVNGCSYCLSAHTAIGKMHNISAEELEANRSGGSDDPKTEEALRFAQSITVNRGRISDEEFGRVRTAGWTDGEIAEIVANVALTTFTNTFAVVSQIDVDFPPVIAGERIPASVKRNDGSQDKRNVERQTGLMASRTEGLQPPLMQMSRGAPRRGLMAIDESRELPTAAEVAWLFAFVAGVLAVLSLHAH